MSEKESVRLSLVVSPELNARLEKLAAAEHSSKTEILKKAIALFDVAYQAKTEDKRLGIFGSNKQLETEIVGI